MTNYNLKTTKDITIKESVEDSLQRYSRIIKELGKHNNVVKEEVNSCFCVGPQNGAEYCPCEIRARTAKKTSFFMSNEMKKK